MHSLLSWTQELVGRKEGGWGEGHCPQFFLFALWHGKGRSVWGELRETLVGGNHLEHRLSFC